MNNRLHKKKWTILYWTALVNRFLEKNPISTYLLKFNIVEGERLYETITNFKSLNC